MEIVLLDPEYLHKLYKHFPQILDCMNEYEPDLYREDDHFVCCSVKQLTHQVTGYGESVEAAVKDWMQHHTENDKRS